MKILIITYSREVNPGTFLQAYGVQLAMKQLFPDAHIDLLKHSRVYSTAKNKKPQHSRKNLTWLKSKVLAIPRRIKYDLLYSSNFNFTSLEFDLFNYDQNAFKEMAEQYDFIVVGSDTILINLRKNGNYGLMWLLGVNANKILFAASAAPANYELSESETAMLYKSFSSFKFLGVRDSQTYDLLSQKIGLNERVSLMFDPTFLIPLDLFNLKWPLKTQLNHIHRTKKIALVNFGDDYDGKEKISMHLRKEGYYVVSTLYNSWANKNLMSLSPFEWAGLFKHIDIVITERFHDSVFSLRNTKPVIAIDWKQNRIALNGKSKTHDLLERYDLGQFHFTSTEDSLQKIIDAINMLPSEFNSMRVANRNDQIRKDYDNFLGMIHS